MDTAANLETIVVVTGANGKITVGLFDHYPTPKEMYKIGETIGDNIKDMLFYRKFGRWGKGDFHEC